MPDYLPRKNSELATFADLLAAALMTEPQDYFSPPGEAEAMLAAAEAFAAASRRAGDNNYDTTCAFSAKKAVRQRLVVQTRQVVARLRGDVRVTEAALLRAGLPPRHRGRGDGTASRRRRVPTPITKPSLNAYTCAGGQIQIVVLSQGGIGATRRPPGAAAMQLYERVGKPDLVAHDPGGIQYEAGWRLVGTVGRLRILRQYPSTFSGRPMEFRARWTSPTHETGPLSDVVRAYVA